MGAFLLTEDTAEQLFTKLNAIEEAVKAVTAINHEFWLDNDEAIKLLRVSKRTLQSWRDTGKIGFSQIGHKIYYRRLDVDAMLQQHYNPVFKPP